VTARRLGAVLGALAVLWAAAIYWTSSRPTPFAFLPRGIFAHDKLLHAGAYAILGGLVLGAISAARRPGIRAVVLAAALATLYGATDELHQSKVPNRDANLADLAADAVGAVAGACAAAVILRRRGARASIRD
jgi:VanZ family protein